MHRFLFCFFLAAALSASAPEPSTQSPSVPASTIFKIGEITVDKNARSIRFPATVQLNNGNLEYLLVHEEGKTHESLFATKISPHKIHIAMLLLGAQQTQEIKALPPGQITIASLQDAPEPKGDKVDIFVTWKVDGKEKQIRAEEWIKNNKTESAMTTEPWIYTSSAFFKGVFLAEEECNIIALVSDPGALVNNPRPGNKNDSLWSVLKSKVLPVNTPVEITFQLLPSSSTSSKPSNK